MTAATDQLGDITPRELALLKLIDIQAKENTQLHIQNELIRYNRRFANKKYKVPPRPSVYIPPESPRFTGIPGTKPITYIKEETKPKEEFSKSVRRSNK